MKELISKTEQTIINILPAVLLSFSLITSSLCGFLSAFDLSCDLFLIITCLFFSSLYLGLVTVQKRLFRICGYCIYFCIYFFGISSYGSYVNTGWYYIVNQVIQDISLYLNVTVTWEYQLMIPQTKDAVTLLAIFIGMFLLLPLTSSLIQKKGVFLSFLCTLPLLMIPIYIHREPSMIWMILLCSGFLFVCMMCFSKNKETKDSSSRLSKVRLLLFCYTGGFCTFLILLCSLIFSDSASKHMPKDMDVKTASFESIRTFVQFGLRSLFHSDEASGGISGGLLGNVHSVRPDYQTDLVVEFAPSENETLYLRSFVGLIYDHWHWVGSQELSMQEVSFVPNTTLSDETDLLQSEFEQSLPHASRKLIRIRTMDGEEDDTYVPYYSQEYNRTTSDSYTNYIVYPYHSTTGHADLTDRETEVYLSIPDINKNILKEFCKKNKIEGSQKEVLEQIQELFTQEYTYTMTPGKTPDNEDYVNYFLTKSKKGFCAHFASSAVLLLRTCGIPARYVEGYALPPQDMKNGTILKNKRFEDYHQGYRELESNHVLRCEINDSQAHAWVEYFDKGFGWRVAEFTPPSSETPDQGTDNFWNSFSSLFDRTKNTLLSSQTSDNQNHGNSENQNIAAQWPLFFLSFLLFVPVLFLIVWSIHYQRTYIRCNGARDLLRIYNRTCDRFRKVCPDFILCQTHQEQLDFMRDCCFLEETETFDTEYMAKILETLSYDDLEKESVKKMINKNTLHYIRNTLWNIRIRFLFKKSGFLTK